MAFVAVMSTTSSLAFVFQCTPVESYWVLALWATKHCVNGGALATASSALSFVTDIVILFMPMNFLLGMYLRFETCESWMLMLRLALRVSTREKIQLIVLMSLGTL